MQIIYNTEKHKIITELEKQFGIKEIPMLLLRSGKDKIRGYSGNLKKEEIENLDNAARIMLVGLYLFTETPEGIRLSIDALHLFKDQINKNIIELNEKQTEQWLKGMDLPIEENFKNEKNGFKAVKFKEDFIGCGKLTIDRLINYLPKERRRK